MNSNSGSVSGSSFQLGQISEFYCFSFLNCKMERLLYLLESRTKSFPSFNPRGCGGIFILDLSNKARAGAAAAWPGWFKVASGDCEVQGWEHQETIQQQGSCCGYRARARTTTGEVVLGRSM